jgi:hypothetical protein
VSSFLFWKVGYSDKIENEKAKKFQKEAKTSFEG